jgi:hypothetical protein
VLTIVLINLQALVNFVRIHAKTITIPFRKAKKRVQPGDSDSMITALINQGNKLQQARLANRQG